jgi:hypothetical protein
VWNETFFPHIDHSMVKGSSLREEKRNKHDEVAFDALDADDEAQSGDEETPEI